jgi:hypothetical protein
MFWALGAPDTPDVEPVERERSRAPARPVAPRTILPASTPEPERAAAPASDRSLVAEVNALLDASLGVFYADCIDAHLQPGETAANAREVAPGVFGPFPIPTTGDAPHSAAVKTEAGLADAWIAITYDPHDQTATCTRRDRLVPHRLPVLPENTFQVVLYGAGCPIEIWSAEEAPMTVDLVPGSCGINIQRTDGTTEHWTSDGRSLVLESDAAAPWDRPGGPSMAEHHAAREAAWLSAVEAAPDPGTRALVEELARERFAHFENVQWRDHQRHVDAIHQAERKAGLPLSTPAPAPVDRSADPRDEAE